jgi:hypothetical protein
MSTYTDRNFKSKAELKRALAAGERITYHKPGLGEWKADGTIFLEGPHYPEPHRWYAQAEAKNGVVVAVK